MTFESGLIAVTGATGLQGGAVVSHLLRNGWRVRALTRRPASPRARVLARAGAEVTRADMLDPASLRAAFIGAQGVYSVQNPVLSGITGEIQQGRNVADSARDAGVRHVVYGSAGIGRDGTGVPSWDSKLAVERYMKTLGLPLTILRPMAFMELMTEKKFYPALSTWHVMPALMGSTRAVYWLSADDLGAIAARVFAAPEQFIGRELELASDVRTLDECRGIYEDVLSRRPPHFPLPVWLFARLGFVGTDLSLMWRWLRTAQLEVDTTPTRALLPQADTVRSWLQRRTMSAQ